MSGLISRAAAGLAAARSSLRATGEPCPLGTLHISHPQNMQSNQYKVVSYHAGPRHLLEEQIAKGEFEDNGKDLYFASKDVAAHFGGREDDSVIILLGAGSDVRTEENEAFGTNYFPSEGGARGKVFVLKVYNVCEKWKRYVSDKTSRTPTAERIKLAAQHAYKAMSKHA